MQPSLRSARRRPYLLRKRSCVCCSLRHILDWYILPKRQTFPSWQLYDVVDGSYNIENVNSYTACYYLRCYEDRRLDLSFAMFLSPSLLSTSSYFSLCRNVSPTAVTATYACAVCSWAGSNQVEKATSFVLDRRCECHLIIGR